MADDLPAVYLAGPSGFTEPGRQWHFGVLRPAVESAGFRSLDPWESGMTIFVPVFSIPEGPERDAAMAEANRKAGEANCDMIRAAAAVLAVLDGTDVDSGTAAEIGYAGALGVPVVGLRTDIRLSGDNAATVVNLQVQYFLAELCVDISTAVDALKRLTA
jgi:nucleoside 2-deoxyribosyltransferase